MKRFTLSIDLTSSGAMRTFDDLIGALDTLQDRLRLYESSREPTGPIGGGIRDDDGNVVGSWEIQENHT